MQNGPCGNRRWGFTPPKYRPGVLSAGLTRWPPLHGAGPAVQTRAASGLLYSGLPARHCGVGGGHFRRALVSRPDPLPPANVSFTPGVAGRGLQALCSSVVRGRSRIPSSPLLGESRLVRKSFSKMPNPVHSMQIGLISRKFRSSLSNLFFTSQVVLWVLVLL